MHNTMISLTVKNHPGVMSRITGLFARRAYNLEGILCGPLADSSQSRIYLLVNVDKKLHQVISNLENLYDVYDITVQENFDMRRWKGLMDNWLD